MACSSARHNQGRIDAHRRSPDWSFAPSFMFSSTESMLSAFVSWNVRICPSCETLNAGIPERAVPLNDHSPEFGLSKPDSRLNRVVLPAPFGPMRAVMMPRWISRWSTSTAERPPNCRVTLSTIMIGSVLATPGTWSPTAIPVDLTRELFAGIERQLPLVAENSLRSVDHDQHERESHENEAEDSRLCR